MDVDLRGLWQPAFLNHDRHGKRRFVLVDAFGYEANTNCYDAAHLDAGDTSRRIEAPQALGFFSHPDLSDMALSAQWLTPFYAHVMRLLTVPCIIGLMCSSVSTADEQPEEKPKSEASTESISYFLGISVGQQMAQNGFKLEDFAQESFLEGFSDGVQRKDASLDQEALATTQKAIEELLRSRRQQMMEERKKAGMEYLEKNKSEKGVEVTDSGLQFKVVEEGKGDLPTPEDTVKVHYTGKLINGKTFDSSRVRGQPATFRVSQVIPGWQEGLQKMKVGSRYMFYVPSELAYGERGSRGAIGPNEVLVFDVELLEIK